MVETPRHRSLRDARSRAVPGRQLQRKRRIRVTLMSTPTLSSERDAHERHTETVTGERRMPSLPNSAPGSFGRSTRTPAMRRAGLAQSADTSNTRQCQCARRCRRAASGTSPGSVDHRRRQCGEEPAAARYARRRGGLTVVGLTTGERLPSSHWFNWPVADVDEGCWCSSHPIWPRSNRRSVSPGHRLDDRRCHRTPPSPRSRMCNPLGPSGAPPRGRRERRRGRMRDDVGEHVRSSTALFENGDAAAASTRHHDRSSGTVLPRV